MHIFSSHVILVLKLLNVIYLFVKATLNNKKEKLNNKKKDPLGTTSGVIYHNENLMSFGLELGTIFTVRQLPTALAGRSTSMKWCL